MHRILVRRAESGDVAAMHALLHPFAAKKVLLPRTQDELFQHLQEFMVAEYDGVLVGMAALHVYAANLAEVRSLVVSESHQGMGIGRLLVEGCEKVALELGVECLFALTYVVDFFGRLGFGVVPKESLPHKVWTVCIHCDRFSHCDEVAVRKMLTPRREHAVVPILEDLRRDE